jgi:hypothetical protein
MISRGSYLTEYVEIPLPNGKSIAAYVFDGEYYYNLGDICKSILRKRNLERIILDGEVKFELMRDTKRGRRVSTFTNRYGLFDIVFKMRGEKSFEMKKYILDNASAFSGPNWGGQRNTIPTLPQLGGAK